MAQNIICGIDVGNSYVKTLIAEIDRDTLAPQIIGSASVDSSGMRRGMVVDVEETKKNIRESLEKAQSMAGTKVRKAYVSINGLHIKTQQSHGIIAVSRADNEISQHDVDRVIDAASTVSLPPNREIIHIIPKGFTIDGQEFVKSALGMKGVRLEADVLLVEGLAPYIKNLARCLNANDVEVAEFVFSPLATARAVLDKHQKEHGVLNIDLGGGVSSIALFCEGELIHTATLPVGSRHITNDLAVAFRTSMDRAEEIKKRFGFIGQDKKNGNEQVDLSEFVGEENFVIPRKQIAKIIDARIGELFDIVTSELKKAPSGNLTSAGVVLTGGGSNLDGMLDFIKNRLRLFTKLGDNSDQTPIIKNAPKDPSYATAIGLVAWGLDKEIPQKGLGNFANPFSANNFQKIAKWFKNFLP